MRRLLAIIAVIVALAGTDAPAQAQQVPADGELLEALRAAARGDDYIRVVLADRAIEGRIRDLDTEIVRLAGGAVPLAEIVRVEERHTSGGGVAIGALASGLALGALFMTVAAGLCDTDCGGVTMAALAGFTLGAVTGGLVGALVAPAEVSWEQTWAREP